MSALKDQDPDYGPSNGSSEKHQRIYEENARTSTARKITSIIEREFSEEINAKEKEVLEIQERLHRASKIIHLLRYVIVSDFYNRKQCQNTQNGEAKQTQIHPAIKQLIGKAPRLSDNNQASNNENHFNTQLDCKSTIDCSTIKIEKLEETVESQAEKRLNEADDESRPKKIPRYIPPKSSVPESQCPSRGVRHKVRKRIIIGNISKWIPPEWREDAASHKWTMYVRGNKENPDIDDFVTKVRFFLHPSYRPNDVVEVTAAPFCLSRRGWGEFPLRVQLHFQSALNKPMDIIHHLKLDRTYTGLQTLGSETLVDIWIYADSQNLKRNLYKLVDQDLNDSETTCKLKVENNKENLVGIKSDLNETVESMKSCDVVIKREPLEDQTITGDIDIQRLRFLVELDHDYCSSKYLNDFEKNLTIDHSTSIDFSEDGEKRIAEKDSSSLHRDSSNLKMGEIMNESALSPSELNRNTTRIPPVSWSKVYTNLRPLEITIPPVFEPSGSKHVLVLKNNKTIPVNDITAPRKEDHTRNSIDDPMKLRTSVASCRGVSLLKKPLGSESTVQARNPNGTKSQQGTKLQLSKSVILNMNSNVPVLKIADRISTNGLFNSEKLLASEKALKACNYRSKESKVSRQKITIGKDKHKLQSKKEFYDEVLRAIETANVLDIQGLLRFIIRRMPMITQDALDPDYRQLHPYACATEQDFFGYTVAKRNACEWSRSRMIQNFLKKKIVNENLWTVKEIMIWARLHGYTPLCRDFAFQTIKQQKSLPDSAVKTISTCTDPDAFNKWLQIHLDRSNDHSERDSRESNESNVEIDVVNIDASLGNNKRLKKQEEGVQLASTETTVLEFESRLMPLYDFVCETARDIGVRLVPEEIAPSVVHCAASRTIMRAIECLVEDLVRTSLAKAWERATDDGYPKMIVLDDVRGALLSREEFDIFTNQGLGTKLASTN
ncbi:uncharacterized protein LOC108622273 [Ceratina calcarata]|uniref:Uncharacterized protein LOC108622273 n=1 Tax=Ceratina calcarata TaxID=156304 RepID=A0AAJ7N3A3_9HYME|nr:uncharacterized protein LOC108622273 [Ceratina calcarata]